MTVTGKVLGRYGGGEELRISRNGCTMELVSIDRTYYGPEWCQNHGMRVTETITADTGEKFDIWRLEGKLVCAIPSKERRAEA